MESEENKLGTKVLTAKDLMSVISPYHTAMARLGSSLISLASAMRVSNDPYVKQSGDEAWERLDQFIEQMGNAAATLDALLKEGSERE